MFVCVFAFLFISWMFFLSIWEFVSLFVCLLVSGFACLSTLLVFQPVLKQASVNTIYLLHNFNVNKAKAISAKLLEN